MATSNKQQIGLLFGVDNTGLDKGSGSTIAGQLQAISNAINKDGRYTQIKFSVDTQATTDQIQKQLNQIAKGLTIKIGGFDQSTIDANAKKQADKTAEQYRKRMESLQRQLQTASNKLTTGGFGGAFDAKRLNNLNPDEYNRYLDALNKAKVAISQFEVINGQLQFGDKTESEVRQAIEAVNNFLNVEKKVSESLNKNNKVIADLEKQANDASIKLAGMGGNADERTYGNVQAVASEYQEYVRLVKEAQKVAAIENKTPQQMQEVIDKTNAAVEAQKRLNAAYDNATAFEKQETVYQKVIARITEYQAKFKETLKNTPQLAAQLEELRQKLDSNTFVGTENKANQMFVSLTNQIRQAGGEAETLAQKIKRIFGEKLGYGIIASAAMMARRSIREMYNNVVQIDTAMTELKKVTEATDESYRKFLDGSAERAQKLGATISDVVTATADFARLGYNLEDASVLSDAATVYKNVGDGITDINQASESIISTMKAFGYEASNVMEIVDKFNTTGNKFAISSGGVGEALLNSASALSAAGNTLDESIALITAANETIQNPEKVGTAMKTLSLYLRAAKTEAEEAGISTDGMANSVSELRDELLALTGNRVDIMISDGDFKSTSQIIIELSKVWSSLSETSQANITELIGGGVRNANVVSALIQNASKIEKIIEVSANSTGSALEENEKYLDSIQGKTARLQATFQELSENVLDSGLVKFFVDAGNVALKFVNLLERIGLLLPTITAGFVLYQNAGKPNSPNMPAYAKLQLVA